MISLEFGRKNDLEVNCFKINYFRPIDCWLLVNTVWWSRVKNRKEEKKEIERKTQAKVPGKACWGYKFRFFFTNFRFLFWGFFGRLGFWIVLHFFSSSCYLFLAFQLAFSQSVRLNSLREGNWVTWKVASACFLLFFFFQWIIHSYKTKFFIQWHSDTTVSFTAILILSTKYSITFWLLRCSPHSNPRYFFISATVTS